MDETKDIKDYLHLYLECECKMTRPSYHAVHELGLSLDRIFVLGGKLLTYFIETTTTAQIKLILRPLSDIKIEEAAWCLRETFFEQISYPIRDFKLELVGQQGKNPRITISNDWYDETLTFGCDTGSVWSTNNGTRSGVKIKSSIFNYLRKQGIDCDGLIAAGLAIDKTTLNSKSL